MGHLVGQHAVKGWILAQVTFYNLFHPLKLSLNEPFRRFSACGKEHLFVAISHPLLGERHGSCHQTKPGMDHTAQGIDGFVSRTSGKVEENHGRRQGDDPRCEW